MVKRENAAKPLLQYFLFSLDPWMAATWRRVKHEALARYQIILLGEQRHMGVNNLPRVVAWRCVAGHWTRDLLMTSPTLYRYTAGWWLSIERSSYTITVLSVVTVCSLNAAMVRHFTALGSRFITKLKFRDLWAFVGQRGIKGTSPIEQVPVFPAAVPF